MFGFCQDNICICKAENQNNVWILSGQHLYFLREKPVQCLDSLRTTKGETSTMFGFFRTTKGETSTMFGFCQDNICICKGETSTMFGFCQNNICICQAEKSLQCLDSVSSTFAFVWQRNQYNVWMLSGKRLYL
jgi:hypothetical protein